MRMTQARLRKFHRWGAWFCLLPILLISVSGVVLHLRKTFTWIQPEARVGTPGLPTLSIAEAFNRVKKDSRAGVRSLQDIKSMDVRLVQGVFAFRTQQGLEIQMDGVSGQVLSIEPRRTGWIADLHEGSFFKSKIVTLWFMVSGLALFALALTGAFLLLNGGKILGIRGILRKERNKIL